jgi:uncharacterized LabA/DUF88 family protein
MERVIAYVDGFNLYFGLKSAGYERYLWLDVHGLACDIINPHTQSLVTANYFTSRVSDPPDKAARQSAYIEALQAHRPNLKIHYGQYQHSTKTCRQCGHTHSSHSEKMTDVNIACELLHDAFEDAFDVALLISGDSDLATPITKTRTLFPKKRVVVAFPPNRKSKHLKQLANGVIDIKEKNLAVSQIPPQVQRKDGFVLSRPASWI